MTDRPRVLVIDDEESLRRVVLRILEDEHHVTLAACAEEAIALLDQGATFDVILCDLMMGGMNGMELYDLLVEENPRAAARMAFLTGSMLMDGVRSFLERVPNPRLAKPFGVAELNALVSEALSRFRAPH